MMISLLSVFAYLCLSLLPMAVAEDLMAVCYSFTSVDVCHPHITPTGETQHRSRTLLAKQGKPRSEQKRRDLTSIDCGVFCSDWSTFCAEYKCDADTIGMTCDDIVAEAKAYMQSIAEQVGTEECKNQMDPNRLECICVDQDK